MTLAALASRYCAAHRPALTLDGFCRDRLAITASQLRRIAGGECHAADRFLQGLHATHVRLFPSEPVRVLLPDARVVHLSAEGMTITFPKPTNP